MSVSEFSSLVWVLRELIEDPALLVDGTRVEEVDGASLNTWRDRVEIG